MRQIPLAIAPPPACCFDSTLPGRNGEVLDHLLQLAPHAAPTYLWGPAGCGKTHLLRALAADWQARGGRVAAFDPSASLPWDFDERVALIVLDGSLFRRDVLLLVMNNRYSSNSHLDD